MSRLLLITAFWAIDPFTTKMIQAWNLDNFRQILNEPTYLRIIGRTVFMAALVLSPGQFAIEQARFYRGQDGAAIIFRHSEVPGAE